MSQLATHEIEALPKQTGTATRAIEAKHADPTEEQIARVVFAIIMGAAALFIGATLFLSHM